MNTSLKWIKDLVPGLDCTAQEYMDAMTLSGSKVEGYTRLDENLEKIVVGQIKKIEKHSLSGKGQILYLHRHQLRTAESSGKA